MTNARCPVRFLCRRDNALFSLAIYCVAIFHDNLEKNHVPKRT